MSSQEKVSGKEMYRCGFNAIKACRNGTMLYGVNDRYIGKSLEVYGEFSYFEQKIFSQLIKPGQLVLDVGANIGVHTLCFSKLVGEGGAVYAFEPQRIVFQQLCANIALNSIMNTACLQNAVGEAPGSLMVPVFDFREVDNYGGLGLGEWSKGEKVSVITIDSLKLKRCHFIKADVEGMEVHVLKGARETIEHFKPLMYVENDREDKSKELIKYIASLGYRLFWSVLPMYNADNYFKNPKNIFPGIVSKNMLCIPSHLKVELPDFKEIEV